MVPMARHTTGTTFTWKNKPADRCAGGVSRLEAVAEVAARCRWLPRLTPTLSRHPERKRGDLSYTPRSRKLDRLVNNGLVRSLAVCAARDDSISLVANSFGVASQKVVAGIADPGASTFAFHL